MLRMKLGVIGLVVAAIATIGLTAANAATTGIPAAPGATVTYTVTVTPNKTVTP